MSNMLGKKIDDKSGFSMESLGSNMREVMWVRNIAFIVGGCACGILGITGLLGLLFYLLIGIGTALVLMVKMGFETEKYTSVPGYLFIVVDLVNMNHMMSFTLFWTLAYALVYIY